MMHVTLMPSLPHFLKQRIGKAAHRKFGGAVAGHVRRCRWCRPAGNVHDVARCCRFICGSTARVQKKVPCTLVSNIGFQSSDPKAVDWPGNAQAGVVDQHVDFRAQLAQGVGEGFGHGVLVAHVAFKKLKPVVRQTFGGSAAPAGHGRAAGQQGFDGGAANSFAGAGHDGDFTVEVHLSLRKLRHVNAQYEFAAAS